MNLKPIFLGVFAIAVAAMYFFAGTRSDAPAVGKARELVAAGALLVDVRSPTEFQAGHIEGARNIPIDTLSARLGELGPPASTSVVVYCQSGGRSTKAAAILRDAGFTAVHNMGPMSAWQSGATSPN
jgi:phage shock protein E